MPHLDDGKQRSNRLRELWEELQTVLSGRRTILDSVVPAVVFVAVNATAGLQYALWCAIGLAASFAAWRLVRRQRVTYAIAGLGAVVVASAFAVLLDRAAGFFVPSIASGVVTAVGCGLSVLVRKPLVAWTSHFARRWPLEWYWHPRVRRAYSEVTLAWAVFFTVRVCLQLALLARAQGAVLGAANLVSGWPATILLLLVSYLYGSSRLRALRGPSVEEFRAEAQAPWQGQRLGF